MQRLGSYEVLEEVARGDMGAVFRAFDPRRDEQITIQRWLDRDHPNAVLRFQREGEALECLRHAHVVQVYEVGLAPEGPYLVEERLTGETLQARLDRDGPLDEREAVRLVLQVADAVDFAHAVGVLHRDLRPGNVLIDGNGHARLTNFGVTRELSPVDSHTHVSRRDLFLGTLGYAAPEQVGGEAHLIDASIDAYGVGALLYAALTGRPPLEGAGQLELLVATQDAIPAPATTLRRGLAPELEALCAQCLEKAPQARPTLVHLVTELAGWLGVRAPSRPPRYDSLLFMPVDPEAETVLNRVRREDPPAETPVWVELPEGEEQEGISRPYYLGIRRPLTAEQESRLIEIVSQLHGLDEASAREACQPAVIPVLEYASPEACAAVEAQLVELGFAGKTTSRRPREARFQPRCPACQGPGGEGDRLTAVCPRCSRRFHAGCLEAGTCGRCVERNQEELS